MAGNYTLANEQMAVTFDTHGSITSIINHSTSTEFVSQAERSRLFRIVMPYGGWDGHHMDNGGQTCEARQWQDEGEQHLVWRFDGLTSEHGHFDIGVEVAATLAADALHLALTVENRTPYELTEVWFPWLGGLRYIAERPAETQLLVPGFFQGQHFVDPYAAFEPRNGWLTTPPGRGRRLWLYPRMMQWVDFYTAEAGLYFAMHDPEPRVKGLLVQRENLAAPDFEIAWVRYPQLGQGERFVQAGYTLATHEGDWHAGADRYRAWLNTWVKPCAVSPTIRESLGWHFAFLKHGDGREVRPYAELPALFADAQQAGLDCLQLFGAHEAGMDRGYPDYAPVESYGGAPALRAALDTITAQGGRVALYQAGSAATLRCGPYSNAVLDWANRTPQNKLHRADWTWNLTDTARWRREVPYALMCYGSGWRDVLVEMAARFIGEYGASAVHLDHIGDFDFLPCYSEAHRHTSPDESPAEISDLLESLCAQVKALNPDGAVHVEGLSELSLPWVDVHWGQNALDRMPEVIRYTMPEALFTTTIQENEFGKAARAFVYGLLFDVVVALGEGSIGAYPGFAAYLAKLAQLRKTLKQFLVYGTYRDVHGLVTPEGVLGKVYTSKAGVAVPLVNVSAESIRGRVQVDTTVLDAVVQDVALIYDLKGQVTEVSTQEITLALAPDDLRVVVMPAAGG